VTRELDTTAVAEVRDLLWGEAYRCWLMGGEEARWWFNRGEEQAAIDQICADFTAQHHWYPEVARFVRSTSVPFTVSEVLGTGLSITLDRQTSAQARDVAAILRQLGCKPAPRRVEAGAYVRRWVRP
jgi:predicted P-loop ATPase